MSRYDVTTLNTDRIQRFKIDGGAAPTFALVKGVAVPTSDQRLGQLRLNAMVRAISAYSTAVEVSLDATGQFITVGFETANLGEFNGVTAIIDTLGVGGMASPKTKDGLQLLATAALASKFGTDGVTTLFDGTTVLADTTATTLPAVAAVTVTAL